MMIVIQYDRGHWRVKQARAQTGHDFLNGDGSRAARRLDHDAFRRKRIMILSLCLSMIFSENRSSLFRIML
ncbi:hypothetical protein HL667_28860 [Bradyrhizobium sp. 83012]|uniref:Uncharacterized protein n=1 Tax=Bradyrhizobium aeschynomenes TaxID=2734909 RepID=A0ABX2CMJ8_9BRAD|nr:hypothetical protein [Bradyrhizobium aeschynomenes]NPU69045.1 hypothetical protein [Bradyrhizobium aeschynomenes]